MNYNQNKKLMQITPHTLIIGIDIAKHKHVARAQDDRGYEFGLPLPFENSISGFEQLRQWLKKLQKAHHKDRVIIGVEPTGHYWLDRFFPEFRQVFAGWDGKTALYTLEHFALPSTINTMSAEEILSAWRQVVKRGVGLNKAKQIKAAAERSIGLKVCQSMAQFEIRRLVQQYQQLTQA